MAACGKCHRGLKNPKSIELGYGPVCWEKMQNDTQLNLFNADQANASDFDYRIDRGGAEPVLVITDLDRGGMSVTNNIDAILARIERDEGAKPEVIVYRDSEGNYDGVRIDDTGRAHFYPLTVERRVTNEQEAAQAARKARCSS